MTYRTELYTNEEFLAIERNSDGDIISMYDHFILLTPEQVSLLTEDDCTRYYDLREELNYELSSLLEEFGK